MDFELKWFVSRYANILSWYKKKQRYREAAVLKIWKRIFKYIGNDSVDMFFWSYFWDIIFS
jgi:hypothetical protein